MKKTLTYLSIFFISYFNHSQNYSSAESVEYDSVNNRWLVSNGNRIISDDGQGNLSYFGNGATSYGLEVIGNTLFGIQGSSIIGYDLTTEQQVTIATISGASFLNGMTSNGVNTVYVTDFSQGKIHKVDFLDFANPIIEEIVSNTQNTPNGILYDESNNRLIYVSWGNNAQIKQVNLSNNQVSTIVTTILGNIDGIDDDAVGNFYVSSWSPDRITKYDSNFQNPETVDTPSLSAPADIGINKTTGIMGIPMGNNVIFVDLGVLSIDEYIGNRPSFTLSNNPIDSNSKLEIFSNQTTQMKIELFDVAGKKIKTISDSNINVGKTDITLEMIKQSPGVYFIKAEYSLGKTTKKVIIK